MNRDGELAGKYLMYCKAVVSSWVIMVELLPGTVEDVEVHVAKMKFVSAEFVLDTAQVRLSSLPTTWLPLVVMLISPYGRGTAIRYRCQTYIHIIIKIIEAIVIYLLLANYKRKGK